MFKCYALGSIATTVLLVTACGQEPAAPEVERVASPDVAAAAATVGSPIILTDDLPAANWLSFGINDSGWVFASSNLGGNHLMAWRSQTDADTFTVAPPEVSGHHVTSRGDFIGEHTLWTLSEGSNGSPVWNSTAVTLPAGWMVTHYFHLNGLNDGSTAVGEAQLPSRSVTDRKGNTTTYFSPFAWTPSGGADTLRLPAAPPGCKYTNVYAEEINNSGTIVGYGEQEGSSKAGCVTRALIWRSRTARADTLPRSPVIVAGFPKSVTPDKPLYRATEINDRGDIAGYWTIPGAAVALRWIAPSGGGAYNPPEQLAGNYPVPVDMDECGRVMLRESDWVGSVSLRWRGLWELGGGVTSLPIPAGYEGPRSDAMRHGVAVTAVVRVGGPNSETAVLAWSLSSCP